MGWSWDPSALPRGGSVIRNRMANTATTPITGVTRRPHLNVITQLGSMRSWLNNTHILWKILNKHSFSLLYLIGTVLIFFMDRNFNFHFFYRFKSLICHKNYHNIQSFLNCSQIQLKKNRIRIKNTAATASCHIKSDIVIRALLFSLCTWRDNISNLNWYLQSPNAAATSEPTM